MPLYEYGCEQCGHVVEKLQSSPDSPPPEACGKCGTQGSMTRLISNTSFQLKGSGWYVTDYANSKSTASGSSSETSSSSDSGGSDTSSSTESTSSDSGTASTDSAD